MFVINAVVQGISLVNAPNLVAAGIAEEIAMGEVAKNATNATGWAISLAIARRMLSVAIAATAKVILLKTVIKVQILRLATIAISLATWQEVVQKLIMETVLLVRLASIATRWDICRGTVLKTPKLAIFVTSPAILVAIVTKISSCLKTE